MDFSGLDKNDRLAAIAAAVVVVAGFVAAATYSIYSMAWFAVIAALALLFVVFQPQVASGVSLPGSKGSLMLLLGGVAGVIMILTLLVALRLVFLDFGFADIMFLAAVVGGVAAAWAGWQEFQGEGGKLQLGTPTASTVHAAADEPPPAPVADPGRAATSLDTEAAPEEDRPQA